MQSGSFSAFYWPDFGNTVAIAALVLAVAVVVFGIFSGARANKLRVIFAVILATALGWLIMPLALQGGDGRRPGRLENRADGPALADDALRRLPGHQHLRDHHRQHLGRGPGLQEVSQPQS